MSGLSAPSAGEVRLHGETVSAPRSEMMFVFQQYTKSIFPWKTVLDNVMLALKYRASSTRSTLRSPIRARPWPIGRPSAWAARLRRNHDG